MMTEIHARPPKSSSLTAAPFSSHATGLCSRTLTADSSTCAEGSDVTTSETSSNGTGVGKKRPLSDKSLASTVNGAEKKKKDKKKALKRL